MAPRGSASRGGGGGAGRARPAVSARRAAMRARELMRGEGRTRGGEVEEVREVGLVQLRVAPLETLQDPGWTGTGGASRDSQREGKQRGRRGATDEGRRTRATDAGRVGAGFGRFRASRRRRAPLTNDVRVDARHRRPPPRVDDCRSPPNIRVAARSRRGYHYHAGRRSRNERGVIMCVTGDSREKCSNKKDRLTGTTRSSGRNRPSSRVYATTTDV